MKQEENGREAAGTVANGTVAAGETGLFARLAKIHCFLAKFCIFATHKNFASLAKCNVLSEISCFRYSHKFR